jgi:hypothetical protein
LHIKQQSTVAEYIIQFAELMDQLAAYETHIDSKHYTMKFIDGLKVKIRSHVFLEHPKDLDTAYVLASLQEEVADNPKVREPRRQFFSSSTTAAVKGPHPLPLPPLYDKSKSVSPSAADTKGHSSGRATTEQGKMAVLKAYRRALGQCYKC